MKLLGDKVFLRITKDNREGIFSKEITRHDGSKTRLFLTTAVEEMNERHNSLFVSTAIVEAVADSVKHIKVGDTVIIDYTLCNDKEKIVSKDVSGDLFWAHANTSYHKDSLIAPQTRNSRRDQIAYLKGDIDQMSAILGVISNGVLTANDPFVFLEHESNVSSLITLGGIYFEKTEKVFNRRVLAVSGKSTERTGIEAGDIVKVNDADIFNVKYGNRTVDCINDSDCLCLEKADRGLRAV